jgi:hypothetical protein
MYGNENDLSCFMPCYCFVLQVCPDIDATLWAYSSSTRLSVMNGDITLNGRCRRSFWRVTIEPATHGPYGEDNRNHDGHTYA